jgi:hypothetical protein
LFCEHSGINCESGFDFHTVRGYTLLAHTPIILFRAEEAVEEDYGWRTGLRRGLAALGFILVISKCEFVEGS